MARRNLLAVLTTAALAGSLLIAGCGSSEPTAAPTPTPSPSASPSPSAVPSPSVNPTPSPTKKPPKPPNPVISRTGSTGVALTFDDGPQGGWTPRILDELKARGVKATFCVIGSQVSAHADLIRRIVNEGHTLCNHSWNHEFALGKWSDAAIKTNLLKTDNAIHAVVPGVPIPYFRQPGGNWTAAVSRVAKSLGKKSLGWSVDPWDWNKPGTSAIVKRVVNNTRSGSIVLLHDGGGDRAQTLAAIRQIIPMLLARKLKLIPMPAPQP
ncbi:peptidoglycan/xylan/chitin deacetylase (PgdA/CDA1 family) [Allocatelliglobosispora scoriae]|uniref:Peptidoglycan/xylan/chitin deacetylase (PgdA/CDA1 family) n=1 Tax=Allocatelliglobosispora scoriae TaxID=643052 RepID=A0A841BTR0_9ACTN|nr:polysaccharide deacetylase family protein [Allocatelliglobosispora scoriae]MBB5870828.1 peptidoglycan/xylan/chitin deacetylase (PgdA/CDA1 family) [Allocatelliglobosispora scoriae]